MAAHRGFVLRLPFLAPPFIEWALRLPEHLRWRDDQRRWIQRQAMAGVLPDEVRLRPTKGELGSIIRADLAANVEQFADLEVVRRGWVDGQAVDAALTTLVRTPVLTDEGPVGKPLFSLWEMLAVEMWLRHGRPSVCPRTKQALHPVIPSVPRSEM
jgi:asparagine synthase (glutamine-hydrolysing)